MVWWRGTFGVASTLAVGCAGANPHRVAPRLHRGLDGALDQARLPALDL